MTAQIRYRTLTPLTGGGGMRQKVLDTIVRHKLLAAGDRVLVAVSGGPDSVTLLAVLRRLRKRLGI